MSEVGEMGEDEQNLCSRGEISQRAQEFKKEHFGQDLSVDEIAYILDLDRSTILRYIRNAEIAAYQVGREWRVTEESIRIFIETAKAGKTYTKE